MKLTVAMVAASAMLAVGFAAQPMVITTPVVPPSHPTSTSAEAMTEVVQQYCTRCHSDARLRGDLSLEDFSVENAASDPAVAERMIRKLRAGMMPPPGARRPAGDTLVTLVESLEEVIDDAAEGRTSPGNRPFQRVNRAEYERLVDELFGLTVDASTWLPEDQISASFDNVADVQGISATLMDAYLTAASDVARQAVGQSDAPAASHTYSNDPAVSQHEWETVEGAPYGTRGGVSVLHTFPADGKYIFTLGFMSGWGERFHDIDVSVDGAQVALLRYSASTARTIDFQGRLGYPMRTDSVFVRAGQHRIAAAFIRQTDGPYEDLIRPNDWSLSGTEASYGTTSLPHLMHLTVEGPYEPTGVSETPSRSRIFSCRPTSRNEERPCAEEIITRLAAQAYRRELEDRDVDALLDFYDQGAGEGGFELGIRTAIEAMLVSPYFLFRIETEPGGVDPGEIFPVEDVDLASRLSFFLWGVGPDERLLDVARRNDLSDPDVLEREARRMLEDPRSASLSTRFAHLWLRLQDLEKVQPDAFWFPNYSRQLSTDMRRETELFFDYLVREDRSLLDLLEADYTFVNERLASHYGIDGVIGDDFRRVPYPDATRRGLLGHGSVLVQTSLANRTSPVLRGKWVMEVLLGVPPPPPPPGVPDLEETASSEGAKILTTSERMAAHRANPTCASCHNLIDPIGLALDNFDVTGKWRTRENGMPLDTRGTYYDGSEIATASQLADALLERPIPLVRNFTEKLMTYALGRRIEVEDQPSVREIAREASRDDYQMSAFIVGVVRSDAFRMKQAPDVASN
ncbi:MAG: DUF1592 domain-containing protein [Gemmatimonadota bacterium]